MYKRVLLPVDGSEIAEAIVPFILDIAGPLDFEVVLLKVINDPTAQREEAEAYLAGLAAEMRAKGVKAATSVRRGEPVDEILAAARDEGADLIAMTTHGRTGPARLLFGSVAEGVLRDADIPVFLMRQTEREIARRQRAVAAWAGR
jgi:nucleotide-binding universal stress UspA family protein